jgi:hypothetical protein
MTDAEWYQMLRRSYGIPDVIDGNVATARLVQILKDEVFGADSDDTFGADTPEIAVSLAATAVTCVAAAGVAGNLDRFIAGFPLEGSRRTAEEISREDVMRIKDDQRNGVHEAVEDLLLHLKAFIDSHPFYEPRSGYFS